MNPTIFSDEPNDLAIDEGISLREAIDLTPSGGTIELEAGTYFIEDASGGVTDDDDNQRGDFDIVGKTLTIRGAGEDQTFIDAQQLDRVFHVLSGATLILEGVTIQNGGDGDAVSNGGGIFNQGTLQLTASTVSGNTAEFGGGIDSDNGSTFQIERSTIENNTASYYGGGLYYVRYGPPSSDQSTIVSSTIANNYAEGSAGGLLNNGQALTLINSTISGNSTDGLAGGILNIGAIELSHVTIANNSASTHGGIYNADYSDFVGVIQSLSNSIIAGNTNGDFFNGTSDAPTLAGVNIIADGSLTGTNILNSDPLLGDLAQNGGGTATHTLLEGSPAIDTASSSVAAASDQRNLARDDAPDIGSFELLEIITILESAQSTKVLEGFSGANTDPDDTESDRVGDFYLVNLNYKPSAEVTVNLAADLEIVNLASETLTFTPEDWNIAQLVFLGAVDDRINTGVRSSTIGHSSTSEDALYLIDDIAEVNVEILDNDGDNGETKTLQNETTFGSDKNDVYTGSDGVDKILGKGGIDLIFGRGGNDQLFGGDDSDGISGGDGPDYVNGEAGDDFLSGGNGDDIMYGSLGNDIMSGDGGNDLIFGGDGDDQMIGGAGDDTLIGGLGNDVFSIDGQGADLIADYQLISDSLSLLITEPVENLRTSISDGNTNILDSSGNLLVTLANLSLSNLNNLTILQG